MHPDLQVVGLSGVVEGRRQVEVHQKWNAGVYFSSLEARTVTSKDIVKTERMIMVCIVKYL